VGWVVLAVVVLLVVGFVWRNRKRKMSSINTGPISRDTSTNYGAVQRGAEGQRFDDFRGGI
jgi:FtsZ-interacting cell division protein ZipA